MLPGDILVPGSSFVFLPLPGAAEFLSSRPNRNDGCAFDGDVAGFERNMNIEMLHIGMKVRHPQYGVGVVKSLTEQTAEIVFDDAQRTIAPASSDLQPAEATATLSELEMPLANLIRDTAHAVVEALGLEEKDVVVEGLAARWQRGTLVMQSADSSLQPKEVPLETFFHKIVMIRNGHYLITFGIRGSAAGAFPPRLRAWRGRNNLSQSEAAWKLQISKRTLQE